jgi:adenylosuccinate synthase
VRINGLDGIALTKLDVLDGLREIQVCHAYQRNGEMLNDYPADIRHLADCKPVYETMSGWSRPTAGLRSFDELPPEAKRYIARLEEVSGVAVALISTGSDRADTIVRNEELIAGTV